MGFFEILTRPIKLGAFPHDAQVVETVTLRTSPFDR